MSILRYETECLRLKKQDIPQSPAHVPGDLLAVHGHWNAPHPLLGEDVVAASDAVHDPATGLQHLEEERGSRLWGKEIHDVVVPDYMSCAAMACMHGRGDGQVSALSQEPSRLWSSLRYIRFVFTCVSSTGSICDVMPPECTARENIWPRNLCRTLAHRTPLPQRPVMVILMQWPRL